MAVMENVVRVGRTYKVRKRIPPECRAEFGVRGEFKTVSLGTSDKREAQKRAVPILADIDARIVAIRRRANGSAVGSLFAASPSVRLTPILVETAVRNWRRATIDHHYEASFNGERRENTAEEHDARTALINLLYDAPEDEIPGFYNRFAEALRSQSLDVSPDNPALRSKSARDWFREAWRDVELKRKLFDAGIFSDWPEESATTPTAPMPTTTVGASAARMTISQLRDAWDAVKPLNPRQKGYIRRLIEYLGDVDIATVQPLDMDRYLIELKRFPLTKKPADDRLPFGDLIAKYEGTDQPRLHIKTVWNWTVTYKAMFAFGVSRRLLTHNPAADMMKKPSSEEANDRQPYDDADLDFIFTRPLFTGFEGTVDKGYRHQPGDQVVVDAKYWLPIVALYTGMRLEELASLRTDEIIAPDGEDGIVAFDLTKRPLTGEGSVKNRSARRIVPLHRRLHDLGFVSWMMARANKQEYVFADLSTDAKRKRGSQFGKWWGLWCHANAKQKGQGIDDPSLTFHSFRHSFKRAARASSVKEEIHDLITGHSEGNTVARGYGRGVDLAVLKEAMDQIEIRWP